MRTRRRLPVLLVVLALLQPAARSDYLEVRRSATIKADPNGQAQIHEHVQPPLHLALVPLPDEVNDQRSGYYLIERPGGGLGFTILTYDGWDYLYMRSLGEAKPMGRLWRGSRRCGTSSFQG